MSDVLDARALNRATLARQLLLDRAELPVAAAVAHLGGLQAQEPQEPFVGLWSRLRDFDPAALDALLAGRELVRTVLMRRTIHLVTSMDALAWRARHASMLRRKVATVYRRELAGVDLDEVAAAGRELLADGEPRTMGEIGRALAQRWPQAGPRPLGELVVAAFEAMAQLPPRGLWRQPAGVRNARFADWLGRAPEPLAADGPDRVGAALVRRYLAAFGPAASADLRAWCGLTGLPAAVKAVRDELIGFRDARGRELLDLPGAPRPDRDTPAPVQFLPAFDNVVLGYHDRSRIIDDEHRLLSVAGARLVLVDGRVAATWTVERSGPGDTVLVAPLRRLTGAERSSVEAEAHRLASFLSDGASAGATVGRHP